MVEWITETIMIGHEKLQFISSMDLAQYERILIKEQKKCYKCTLFLVMNFFLAESRWLCLLQIAQIRVCRCEKIFGKSTNIQISKMYYILHLSLFLLYLMMSICCPCYRCPFPLSLILAKYHWSCPIGSCSSNQSGLSLLSSALSTLSSSLFSLLSLVFRDPCSHRLWVPGPSYFRPPVL